MFRLGLIVNPMAGLGGSVALKGSDGAETARRALELGAVPQAGKRALQALAELGGLPVEICTCHGVMGEDVARQAGFSPRLIDLPCTPPTTAAETRKAAQMLADQGVDLLLFAGGDGTARDICAAVGERVVVLGIPAGVKIHSGVYAVTPAAAGRIVAMLVRGELVTLTEEEVRDIDEEAFRQGRVQARWYGEMRVPAEPRYLQHTKSGGREVEELVLADIAAEVIETMEPDRYYVMGSGTTVAAIMEELGLPNTLLGVDLVRNRELVGSDLTAQQLLDLIGDEPASIVVTVIGGQGHIIGRGNQQLSPQLLRKVGRESLIVVATKSKLKALEGRPLIVDSGDPDLNHQFAGVIRVITGYRDAVLYRVADY